MLNKLLLTTQSSLFVCNGESTITVTGSLKNGCFQFSYRVPVITFGLIKNRRCIDLKKLLGQLILNKLFTLLIFLGGVGVKLFIIMNVKERFLLYTFAYEREIVMVNNVWELTGK